MAFLSGSFSTSRPCAASSGSGWAPLGSPRSRAQPARRAQGTATQVGERWHWSIPGGVCLLHWAPSEREIIQWLLHCVPVTQRCISQPATCYGSTVSTSFLRRSCWPCFRRTHQHPTQPGTDCCWYGNWIWKIGVCMESYGTNSLFFGGKKADTGFLRVWFQCCQLHNQKQRTRGDKWQSLPEFKRSPVKFKVIRLAKKKR